MKAIVVAGDFFDDEFNIGTYQSPPRFLISETITRRGGAGNTQANANAICKHVDIHCYHAGYSQPSVLQRWIENDQIVFESWRNESGLSSLWSLIRNKSSTWWQFHQFSTLIVSDYNKGFSQHVVPDMPMFDLLVVDSRYRTAPIENLKHLAKTSIWRCTGTEYEEKYANNFDWVVHTNHDKEIHIFQPGQPGPPVIKNVPPVVSPYPVGAGDTFTAALAAYLTNLSNISWETVVPAVEFAVQAAQDVCRTPYTAVTKVKLESDKCSSQILKN